MRFEPKHICGNTWAVIDTQSPKSVGENHPILVTHNGKEPVMIAARALNEDIMSFSKCPQCGGWIPGPDEWSLANCKCHKPKGDTMNPVGYVAIIWENEQAIAVSVCFASKEDAQNWAKAVSLPERVTISEVLTTPPQQ